jgi:hypothetical protein
MYNVWRIELYAKQIESNSFDFYFEQLVVHSNKHNRNEQLVATINRWKLNTNGNFNILIACCLTNQEIETRLFLWYKTLLALIYSDRP